MYLTYLEKQGIQFNAETKDSMTEYIFIELQDGILQEELDSGNLEEIFGTEFKEEGLSIGKKYHSSGASAFVQPFRRSRSK